ncbi:MAG: FMN-binding protein [Spirochaetales bacterium]|nr:FMN-binding protein [Spirochaetales bacterium]
MKISRRNFIRIITSIVLLLAFAMDGAYGRGGTSTNYSKPAGFDLEKLNIPDGTYKGEANGFRPGLTVEVEVRDHVIVEIAVIEHNEIGPQYYTRPLKYIPDAIIEEQQTDVDVVSGATATSYAIMAAVENALGLDKEE